ncbi:MAG TPA: Dna2/Cas4 domain-containing protein [Tepidimicrobium sp.]|nr:Dna2/Cas4 domain-containing protein [Tepidimicrobium sp.]
MYLSRDRYTSLMEHYISPNEIDVEILEKKDLEVPDNVEASDYYRHYESRLIASRIRELVSDGAFEYGDFALLFRSTKSIDIYERALREYDIPYYNISGRGFFQSQEIIDIMNALKAISNRYDTISTIGFLRSPMVGLSDKGIYWLLRYGEDSILEAMDIDILYIDKVDRDNIARAKEILNKFMIKKSLHGIHRLTKELIDQTYYKETLLLQRGGKQAAANLYKFMDIARDFDNSIAGSLEDFIDYIDSLENTDESQAKIETEDADVVKIMTIHKSKGLQFPVVIVPQMSRRFNYQQPYALLGKDRGIGIRYDDKAILYNELKEDLLQRENEENQRILYVAMTRAKERLMIGNQGNIMGFKAMIKGLIDMEQVDIIEDIKEQDVSKRSVKSFQEDLLKPKTLKWKASPLARQIPGYNRRSFSNFSISQYMEFRQCRRRFFMKYYKRLPFHGIKMDRDMKGELVGSKGLDPITRGNIVHKFCEYYREGINPKELIGNVVKSFGIDYSTDIMRELNPYIENYLRYYNEDYSHFYVEKEFYLKAGDNYISGVIDRINIKDGKAEILDFKTNRVYNKKHLLNIYEPQLQLYAHAFQQISGIEVKTAKILFLETGDLEGVDISEDELEKNFNNIKNFIQFVIEHSSIEDYEKNMDCESDCKYRVLCNIR